jgi:hypothetical protein
MALIPAGAYVAIDPVFAPNAAGACSDETIAKVKESARKIPFPDRAQNVGAFAIDKRRVSCGDYDACVTSGVCPRETSALDCADDAAGVTLEEAVSFCRWRGAKLPTLLQWQAAVRGANGKTTGECDPGSDCTITSAEGVTVRDFTTGSLGEFTSTMGCWYDEHGNGGSLRPLKATPRRIQLYLLAPSTAHGERPDKAEFRCARNQVAAMTP